MSKRPDEYLGGEGEAGKKEVFGRLVNACILLQRLGTHGGLAGCSRVALVSSRAAPRGEEHTVPRTPCSGCSLRS